MEGTAAFSEVPHLTGGDGFPVAYSPLYVILLPEEALYVSRTVMPLRSPVPDVSATKPLLSAETILYEGKGEPANGNTGRSAGLVAEVSCLA